MKKTCDGCRALQNQPSGRLTDKRCLFWCALNYKMDEVNRTPLQECEKPKTYRYFISLIKLKQNTLTP